jgi:hypothetical protein
LVRSARTAILSLATLSLGERRTLAVSLLFKNRP